MQDGEKRKRRSWKSSKPAPAQPLFKPLWSWSATKQNIEHLAMYSMVSLVIPRLEETILAPFLMKTFPKDPNSWTERSQAHLKLFKSELRLFGCGQLETSCLAAKQRRGGDSCSFPAAHNQSGCNSLLNVSRVPATFLSKDWGSFEMFSSKV